MEEERTNKQMDGQALIGKRKLVRLYASLLLISIYRIMIYHSNTETIDADKIIQQSVRMSLTIGLMYAIFKGKKWAKNGYSFCLVVSLIFGVFSWLSVINTVAIIPFVVLFVIYGYALYYFNFSPLFNAFFDHQRIGNVQ
jgi:hypothetical protein